LKSGSIRRYTDILPKPWQSDEVALDNLPTGKYHPKKKRVPTNRFHGISANMAADKNESQ
jgi:hypothetical protein